MKKYNTAISRKCEKIGRERFENWSTSNQPDWLIKHWSKKDETSWDVAIITGSSETQGYVITEIKNRYIKKDSYDSAILEQVKLDGLQKSKTELQEKYPNNTIYVHYVFFYNDSDIPRVWDITNLNEVGVYNEFPVDSYSNDITEKQAIYLKNNEAINLLKPIE